MNGRADGPVGFTELFDLPVAIDLRMAARVFDICTATAYRLNRRGEFPCPVIRLGGKFRVPTAALMRTLGIEQRPLYSLDPDADPDPDALRDDLWDMR
ncbi:DNA-binding protein [Streptomyces sp. NPDC046374]|uniref:DNA-binding protein n=1 Tax=Streptomyces sp. NPDC046374 TaxID=3154917 RepID=UPI0033F42CA9